jgi:hypothetical protein
MTRILKGQAIAFFAFDVGYEVDMEKLSSVQSTLPVQPLSRKKQTPNYLQYATAPQVLHLGETDILFGITGQVQATVFDFGAISISYRWPLAAKDQGFPLDNLPLLSRDLYERNLEHHARTQVEALVQRIQAAIIRPELSVLVEDYYVFVLEALSEPMRADDFLAEYRPVLSQVLRFDTEPLSMEQQTEAVSKAISYYEDDLVLVDWNTAIIYDSDHLDAVNVLEFLNVELQEARYIDAQLDKRIRDYEGLVKQQRQWLIPLYSPYRQAINELAELRIESSLLAERVDNALKLIGDLYLARIHKAATERFYMHEWDTAISRKLDIIGNFYQLLTDRVSHAQTQTLELVIILLILIEIFLSLFHG